MYVMIATIRILPEKIAEWEDIMIARRVRVLAQEPATLQYDMYRLAEDASCYVVIEGFVDRDGAQAHLLASTEHEAMIACFDGNPVLQLMDSMRGCAPD